MVDKAGPAAMFVCAQMLWRGCLWDDNFRCSNFCNGSSAGIRFVTLVGSYGAHT